MKSGQPHIGEFQLNASVGDEVEIKQVGSGSDCGFGFGVMASHVLTLRPPE
jgi:hypothetical protein